MDIESMNDDKLESRWFIDLDWLQENDRSFFQLAKGCLCPECLERLKAGEGNTSADDLITTIKGCCSKASEFITIRLPVLESIFRLLLANGNQPIGLEELGKQLCERRDGDTYRTSVEILSRLLSSDRYYGLRQFHT